LATVTALTNRAVITKAERANAICARRRTAVYEDTHQKNASVLKKYTKHNLILTKTVIIISRTNTNNI
jgi:hypothetical protein